MSDDYCDEDWGAALPKPAIPDVVTTKEIKEAIERVHELAVEKAKIETKLSQTNKLIMSAEMLVMGLLEKAGMKEFPSEYGTFQIVEQSSVSMKHVDKAALFQYLKDTGQFEGLATIHARTFVGWYNREEERAKQEGREMEFSIPGCPSFEPFNKLKYKKPKLEG